MSPSQIPSLREGDHRIARVAMTVDERTSVETTMMNMLRKLEMDNTGKGSGVGRDWIKNIIVLMMGAERVILERSIFIGIN